MKRNDYLLLAGFCMIVFGVSLVGGRPLTMHEAVLPECTREMKASGDWLTPTSGGRPWLHRPPLPHWTLLVLNLPFAEISAPWQVRLGPLVAGLIVALLTAWMAQRWFGRALGLLSGFLLATSFQFVRYAWLAEEDMFLCAVVAGALACFAKLEVSGPDESAEPPRFSFFGWKGWPLFGFFLLLGMSNLAKGLIFGPLMILVPAGAFLLSTRSLARLGRYVWLWGWIAALAVGGAWPFWTWLNHPDVLEMWRYDYGGRLNGGYVAEPFWYYGVVLLWAMLPWTPFVFVGLAAAARQLRLPSPARFLWCWGVGILVFFSIPDGKHHHYFLHSLPAWAMLGALGVTKAWERLPAAVLPTAPRLAWRGAAAAFSLLAGAYLAGHLFAARYADESREDAAFLNAVPAMLEPSVPLLVNAELRSCLEVNRVLFDLGPRVEAIHNLTFLLAEGRTAPRIYLLTQARDDKWLALLGTVRQLAQSPRSRREASPRERLTLFEVVFRPDLPRYSASVYIEQQQIKHRKPGPYLGGHSPSDWRHSLADGAFRQDAAVQKAGVVLPLPSP